MVRTGVEVAIAHHQEHDVTVRAVSPVGCLVTIDGRDGFVDQAKHPSWSPPRLSALVSDVEAGRALRGHEG